MPRLPIALLALSLAIAHASLAAEPAGNSSTSSATISGTVSSRRGPLPNVTVRATDAKTGKAYEARSTAAGAYQLTLPPGSYDLFATPVGFTGFARHGIALAPTAALRIDVTLNDHPNEGTPGELAYLHLRDDDPRAIPRGPAPRLRDGHPDLSGVWYPSQDLEPEDVPFLPWAADYARTHTTADDPRAQCLPSGPARGQQNELTKLIQTPTEIIMLVEGAPPGFRQIFLDGRPHPKELEPSYMGHSTAKWQGDVLVVDTVNFNNRGWIDFNRTPQTEQLHLTERYRRLDLGHLDLVITIDDPGAYSRPWKIHRILTLAQGEEIQEYICNENNHIEHLVK